MEVEKQSTKVEAVDLRDCTFTQGKPIETNDPQPDPSALVPIIAPPFNEEKAVEEMFEGK